MYHDMGTAPQTLASFRGEGQCFSAFRTYIHDGCTASREASSWLSMGLPSKRFCSSYEGHLSHEGAKEMLFLRVISTVTKANLRGYKRTHIARHAVLGAESK